MARKTISNLLTTLIFSVIVLAAGCGGGGRKIKIGSKNFTEQLILGEIIAQYLEKQNLPVERFLNLGSTDLAHQALQTGDIDLYPEYTGTAVAAILKQELSSDPVAILQNARNEYSARFACDWLDPLGFDNSFALVADGPTARKLSVKTLSQAGKVEDVWRLGIGYEFQTRSDGLTRLLTSYGIKLVAAPNIMELGLLFRALGDHQVNLIAANATDGMLDHLDVQMLEDDLKIFPPYQASVVVRKDALAQHAKLRGALDSLSGKISSKVMRKMNYEVDVKKRQPAEVATLFLKGAGL